MSAFVGPQTPEVAQALLALADEQGLGFLVVRTTDEGFLVPDSIGDAYAASLAEKPKPAAKAPARKTEKE
jgi:hypothetical protein